ncbi:MAG: DUF4956 domain-containing protein [Clostridia bacterium]|nr:DUF4956 domain-containing protein [Clostridia bacterium]
MNKASIAEIFASQSITPNSWLSILFLLIMAFVVGLFIYWVYRKNYRGVMFSNNFGLTLVLMTTITAPVVMCIRDSLQLSMGMVGALSIVRFRTAVKDPLDTAYMFWALTMGILIGAGQYFLAAIAVVGIAALVFVLRYITGKSADSYLLVMRMAGGAENAALQVMRQLRYQKLKSKTITAHGIEVTYEVRVEKSEAFLNKLLSLDGVNEASLIAYQSETT